MTYAAAVDPAFKQADFALAIEHRTNDNLIVVDHVFSWTGSKRAPLGFERVCREVADTLRAYAINVVHGDQYAAAAIQQEFLKLGITYKEMTFVRHTRAQLFNNLKHLIQQERIELLDEPKLLRQLRSLEEHICGDGNIDVRPDSGQKDDVAIVVALSAFELSQPVYQVPPTPIMYGHVYRGWEDALASSHLNFDPLAKCGKYPRCCTVGYCECNGF